MRSFLIVFFLVGLTGCKIIPGASNFSEYEKDQYIGQNICPLMLNEARQSTQSQNRSVKALYKEIYDREYNIFEELIEKINKCNDKMSGSRDSEAAQENYTECEGLEKGSARRGDYEAKWSMLLENCPLYDRADYSNKDFVVAKNYPSYLEQVETLNSTGDCNVDLSEECLDEVEQGLSRAEQYQVNQSLKQIENQLKNYCGLAAKVMANYSFSGGTSASQAVCNSEIIKSTCGALVSDANYTFNNILNNKLSSASTEQYHKNTTSAFISSVKGCVKALGKEKVKELAKDGLQEAAQRTFAGFFKAGYSSMANASKNVAKLAKLKNAIAASCGFVGGVLAGKMEAIPQEHWDKACTMVTKFDKHRASACAATLGDVCSMMTGGVSFDHIVADVPDSQVDEIARAITEVGIATAAAAGGPVGMALTGMVSKISEYIAKALNPETALDSNPIAECFGAGDAYRCIGQKWAEFSLGVRHDDFSKPADTWKPQVLPQSTSSPQATEQYYTKNVCWCYRQCYIDNGTFSDDKLGSRINMKRVIPVGEAGERYCKSLEGSNFGGGTYGSYKTYSYKYDCDVVPARVRDKYTFDDENMEIFYNNQWQRVYFPSPTSSAYPSC